MEERSMFFDSVQTGASSYDRIYNSDDFSDFFASFIGNGVILNSAPQPLQTVVKSGMVVTVKAGKAMINGHMYELKEDTDITLTQNTTSSVRRTMILLELNGQTRDITLQTKNFSGSLIPSRTETLYQLFLANIRMPVNATSVSAADISDRRAVASECGWVTGFIEQFDSTDLFAEFEGAFNDWFDTLKGKLGTDVATSLQNQIDALSADTGWKSITSFENSFTQASTEWDSQCAYRKVGKTVYLRGSVKSPSSWDGQTFLNICVLPTGYRPAKRKYYFTTMNRRRMARLLVDTTGAVGIDWAIDIPTGNYLDDASSISWIALDTDFIVD
uniref:Receptor-binding protein n=1 Tax=Dulem virus 36 TaxID=3145754 RepID=A0AAU8B0H2_9CAUD